MWQILHHILPSKRLASLEVPAVNSGKIFVQNKLKSTRRVAIFENEYKDFLYKE
jgi:hypothetical protein